MSAPFSVRAEQVTVTDSEGLTGTETLTMIVGEPFSFEMDPKSGKWVVGDTIKVGKKTKKKLGRNYSNKVPGTQKLKTGCGNDTN